MEINKKSRVIKFLSMHKTDAILFLCNLIILGIILLLTSITLAFLLQLTILAILLFFSVIFNGLLITKGGRRIDSFLGVFSLSFVAFWLIVFFIVFFSPDVVMFLAISIVLIFLANTWYKKKVVEYSVKWIFAAGIFILVNQTVLIPFFSPRVNFQSQIEEIQITPMPERIQILDADFNYMIASIENIQIDLNPPLIPLFSKEKILPMNGYFEIMEPTYNEAIYLQKTDDNTGLKIVYNTTISGFNFGKFTTKTRIKRNITTEKPINQNIQGPTINQKTSDTNENIYALTFENKTGYPLKIYSIELNEIKNKILNDTIKKNNKSCAFFRTFDYNNLQITFTESNQITPYANWKTIEDLKNIQIKLNGTIEPYQTINQAIILETSETQECN